MFEDALMESSGRIRTHRGWFSGIATVCNGGLVCLLLLWPLLHPASLPRQALSMLIAVPAAPLPPVARPIAAARTNRAAPVNPFMAPQRIPNRIARTAPEPSPAAGPEVSVLAANNSSFTGLPDSLGTAVPPQVRMAQPKLAISSGVMEGRRLSGADPRYPAIARAAQVQGTVVLEATIFQGWND